jgi:hypothetical protein
VDASAPLAPLETHRIAFVTPIRGLTQAISPRLDRRDEKLNQQLVPLFDPSGRLFLASEDPIPADADQATAQKELDPKYGVVTINEVRSERGLAPVPWGNVPWLPERWVPTDVPRRFAGSKAHCLHTVVRFSRSGGLGQGVGGLFDSPPCLEEI